MKNNRDKVYKYLQSQNLVAVATKSDRLWVSTVYYVIDDKFNLYFLSEPTTEHCKNILKSEEVACAIYNSKQKVTDKKVGVQLHGEASKVNNLEKIKWMLALWNKVNPGFEAIINLKNMQNKVIKGRIYKIKPKTIKFFNEELYGSEGFEVFEF